MPSPAKVLGVMKPMGGGDPVPLTLDKIVIGRRASNDVCLDFENVSGKHCELHFFHGLWHLRDLGSKNGTTVNGLKIGAEQSILPDMEIGIATHFFTIDYEPAGPASAIAGSTAENEDFIIETPKRKSLMELAGFESDSPRRSHRPSRPPDQIERPSVDEAEFEEDPIPHALPQAPPMANATDDDFFDLIQEDLAPKKE